MIDLDLMSNVLFRSQNRDCPLRAHPLFELPSDILTMTDKSALEKFWSENFGDQNTRSLKM